MWRGRAGRGSGTSNVPKGNYRCADGRRAHKKPSPNGFHHRRIDHDKTLVDGKGHINGLESFRGDAERRRKAYHAGFERNLRLVIRERSFRFNPRDAENTLNYLGSRLRARSLLGDNP